MKILFVADGSFFIQKALKFLVSPRTFLGSADEPIVVHAQDAISAQIERELDSDEVTAYQAKQADKYHCLWVAGSASTQIIEASKRERVQIIVMGTHGHGLPSRMFIGSVAQHVLAGSEIPTLLVT